jgi:hypothetical protein
MIEDGALHALLAFSETIQNRRNKEECTTLALNAFRLLSENPISRNEMLVKGSMSHLASIQRFCTPESMVQMVAIVFNLLQVPIQPSQIELAADIIVNIIDHNVNGDSNVLAYGSACLFLFATQSQFLSTFCIKRLLAAIGKLLGANTPFIQATVVASCETLFFCEALKQADDLRVIIQR